MMEMNNRLRTDLMSGQQYATDGAEAGSLVAEEAKDPCNDTDMAPHAAIEAIDGANVTECYTSVNVIDEVLDKTESKCSADGLTNNTELQLERHVKDVMDATKPRPCSETQLNEASDHAEFEPCNRVSAKEVLSGAELSRFDENHKTEVSEEHNEISEEHCLKNLAKEAQKDAEVEPKGIVNGSEMDPYEENHATQMFDNGNLDLLSDGGEVKEAHSELGLETCHNDQAKDPTNDDMHSEVSNPKLSPKQVTSSLTISSQPLDVVGSERGGCGEITSAYSWDSFADGTFCEEHSKCKLESASTACVVLEIPKHVRPTGIRKITFRFSKRKEDYGTDLSVSVKKLADDKFNEDFYDNQCSVAAAENLANNGFHNQEWTDVENAKLNSSIDGRECHDTGSPSSCVPNMELKMSKKIIPDSYPTNVKKLLSTGILEGARVKYISMSGERELPGIIKGCGYLCGCYTCNFSNMVSAYEFERHAGSKTRHPNNYIYLENGKPIYSIIEELRAAPLSMLDSVIRAVAGSSVNEEYFQSWKASLQHGHDVAYVDSDYQSKHFGMYQSTTSYGRHSTEGSHYPNPYQYSYMAPFSQQGYIDLPLEQKRPIKRAKHNFSSSFWEQKRSTEGGNKKRDNDLHKLLFMPNGLPDGTSLAYYSKGKKILGGYKQGNGIFCSCCNFEISPSQFEAHAGWAAKRQPYRNIYTSSGLTLHDIALMLANGQHIPSSGSDDMCAVCGDGGELIICNGCPRAYHAGCLGLQCSPSNDWHCPYCRDKFGPGRKAAGESRPIIIRLKRVVKAPEFEPGGCVMCRSQDFSAVKFDDRTVIICDQCEKEYHVGCLRECGLCDLKELPEDRWFCSDDCSKIFEALQNLAGSGPEMIPALVSAAIYKKQASIGLIDRSMNDIQWCILSGKSRFPEHLLLLSRAAAIFRECFDPIVAKSGRDIIPVMVYGRNISGQEFGGMYCVVLLVKSVVVSAALLRIFGKEVAELPLVATERVNQGKGYFQALFSCIESYLSSLSVKHLVLPAAVDAEPMWTNKLGFRKTSNEQMLKYTRDFQLTIFKGTSLLEKEVNGSRQF